MNTMFHVVHTINVANVCQYTCVVHMNQSTTCGYICRHQQVGQSITMKKHTQTLISATYFP